jgi:PII-like signaling protein
MSFVWPASSPVPRWLGGCRMAGNMAVQVTIYLTEGDSWQHRPLHMEILKYLRKEDVFGAVVYHAVAGFLGRSKVHTAHLVEAGGELPVVLTFVDTDEHVSRVLPHLREMAAHRLIVRENVVIEQGSLG